LCWQLHVVALIAWGIPPLVVERAQPCFADSVQLHLFYTKAAEEEIFINIDHAVDSKRSIVRNLLEYRLAHWGPRVRLVDSAHAATKAMDVRPCQTRLSGVRLSKKVFATRNDELTIEAICNINILQIRGLRAPQYSFVDVAEVFDTPLVVPIQAVLDRFRLSQNGLDDGRARRYRILRSIDGQYKIAQCCEIEMAITDFVFDQQFSSLAWRWPIIGLLTIFPHVIEVR
jgi:hypothetical protein